MRLYENQRGQVLPIVAISLAALMGFGAFAVDLGYLRYQQRLQQYAVDAAAIAAAQQLQTGNNPTNQTCGTGQAPLLVCSAGQGAAGTNGFTNNGTTKVVSVNYPPASGAYQGDNNAVEALVTAQQPAFFSRIFGNSSNLVTTRAVAIIRGNPNGPCIYAMKGDLVANNGSAQINAPCGILVAGDFNARSAGAVNVPSIGAAGSGNDIQCGPCDTSKTIESQNILPFSDPCSTIPGCLALTADYPLGSTPTAGPVFTSCISQPSGSSSLTPNCYTSLSGGTIDLTPGLYVIQGDAKVDGFTCTTCATDNSDGVTLVVGGQTIMNQSTSSIHAPPAAQGVQTPQVTAGGGAPGMLWYDTSTDTSPSNGSSLDGTWIGMLYAPAIHFTVNDTSTLTVDFLVVGEIQANGIVLTVPNNNNPGFPQTPKLAE